MRQSLGTAVFAGMLGVTLFGLVFTPVFYVLIRAWAASPRRQLQLLRPGLRNRACSTHRPCWRQSFIEVVQRIRGGT